MSQPMEKQAAKPPAADTVPTQWTFSVNVNTTAAFDPNAYRIIAGAATLNLQQNPHGYTGTMKFNAPTMAGNPNATQGQKNWSQQTYPLVGINYANGILSFTVPSAVPAFLNNFNGNNGNPIPPAPAGPSTGTFAFAGSWDGVSNNITGGCCWVPPGWLMDAGGVFGVGAPPPNPVCPPEPGSNVAGAYGGDEGSEGDGGEGGGGDPPMGTWGSGGA